MLCKHCGKEVKEDVKTCPNCGSAVVEETAQQPLQPTVVPTKAASAKSGNKVAKPKGYGIAAIVLFSLSLFAMGLCAICAFQIVANNPIGGLFFIMIGGYVVFLIITTPGLIINSFVVSLASIFAIIQLRKTKRAFSWVVFGIMIFTIVVCVAFTIYFGINNLASMVSK